MLVLSSSALFLPLCLHNAAARRTPRHADEPGKERERVSLTHTHTDTHTCVCGGGKGWQSGSVGAQQAVTAASAVKVVVVRD